MCIFLNSQYFIPTYSPRTRWRPAFSCECNLMKKLMMMTAPSIEYFEWKLFVYLCIYLYVSGSVVSCEPLKTWVNSIFRSLQLLLGEKMRGGEDWNYCCLHVFSPIIERDRKVPGFIKTVCITWGLWWQAKCCQRRAAKVAICI